MKNETLAGILRVLKNGMSCKRDIQSRSGLSWGAVSENINLLRERRVIVPSGEEIHEKMSAGRRSSRFEFSRTGFLCMGMELQRSRIITALVDLGGRVLGENVYVLKSKLTSASLSQSVRNAFDAQLKISGLDAGSVISLSFSLTGAVDCVNRIWLQSSHVPEIRKYDFGKLASHYSGLAYLSVEHDIFAKARATLSRCKWKDDNFVFLHLCDGVGMAVHDHNGFIYGNRGLSGEIGHVPCYLPERRMPGRKCSCGQYNCLETFLSMRGIMNFARHKLKIEASNMQELYAVASSRQMDLVYGYLRAYLLQACVTAVNIFDPGTLILGGEIVESWLDRLQTEFIEELRVKTWMQSPPVFKSYRMESCNSAFGAALNAIDPVIAIVAAEPKRLHL